MTFLRNVSGNSSSNGFSEKEREYFQSIHCELPTKYWSNVQSEHHTHLTIMNAHYQTSPKSALLNYVF